MLSKILALSLVLAACAGTPKATAVAPQPAQAAPPKTGLQIKLVTVYVDDQEKALQFYTNVLGFQKKDDFSNGGFRWLTVTDGTNELQLAKNDSPAAKAFQQAMFKDSQPAIMFYTNDIAAQAERIKRAGGELSMPPTDVTMSTIAQINDGVGNLIQITELQR